MNGWENHEGRYGRVWATFRGAVYVPHNRDTRGFPRKLRRWRRKTLAGSKEWWKRGSEPAGIGPVEEGGFERWTSPRFGE